MPRRPKGSVPALVHHKPSNRARVRINGRDHWLGKWGTPEARAAYDRLIAEFLASGRITPPPSRKASAGAENAPAHPGSGNPASPPPGLTVVELAARYLDYCDGYYRDEDGKRTSTYGNALQAVRALRPFDDTPAAEFGPKKLRILRDAAAASGQSRKGCNALAKFVRQLFRWAEEEELVPRGVFHSLQALRPLQQGRTVAPERPPVLPVADEIVDATLPYLSDIIGDMVRFQRLTGARPGEVCRLRPADIDRIGDVWVWRPWRHKTRWRGKERVIQIGPRAQKLLKPYLLRDANAYCFSPAEAEQRRRRLQRLARKTPLTPSQRRRKPKPNGRRRPGDHYTTRTYRQAIDRATTAAKASAQRIIAARTEIEEWKPNQLRHSAGTEVRRRYGLEAAQVVLGHSSAHVTQVYAERDQQLASRVMREIG
jgi:integrase